jgi:RNA-directed DNA polymerase
MSGPGDRAPKEILSGEQLTPLHQAESHEADPNNVDLDPSFSPGSKSSARSQLFPAREPGDLDGASSSVVDDRQSREGSMPQSATKAVEESDEGIVPRKSTKTRVTPVESTEGRPEAKGKSVARNASPTQRGSNALTCLQRIGQRAKEKPKEKWTTLLSHVTVALLKEAYLRLRKDAATGVDGVTWHDYGARLDERLAELEDRVHRGNYHPQPVRRVRILKADGKTRPLGVPALEDKIVQQAVRMVLEPIYEAEFIGFSYGFRPKRSAHDALDALAIAIAGKVNWVLDADIKSFFDTIDHRYLQKFLEHRIGDKRMIRLLMKWVNAGVLENGQLHAAQVGTPQGGIISPLLANVYLHYVLDLWVQSWRKKHAHGEMYVVRYADDFVMAFQREEDALLMRKALAERLAKFALELHPDKTRVIEFGRFAREKRARRRLPKPETFEFLGFVHIASTDKRGKFQLKRQTSRKKQRAKLARLKEEIERRRHHRVVEQHAWLSLVLQGHYHYYAVPTNSRNLGRFRYAVTWLWHRSLQRRSQRGRWTVAQLQKFERRFPLPLPRILHPWPSQRFGLR